MKLLVVGCGSIGRRHAANAARLAETAVYDPDRECARATGLPIFDDLNKALAWKPDGVIVATPHSSHLEIAGAAVEAGTHVLVEKPLAHDLDGVGDFIGRAAAKERKVFVVCNMRFHPGIEALRRNLSAVGSPSSVRAHFGSHLPDMRQGVDYRELECVQPGKGGVILDNVHEIDYLMWLFGDIVEISACEERSGSLDIEVADRAELQLRHRIGVRSEIHLDWTRRPKLRGCEIVGSEGTLAWCSEGKAPERCRVTFNGIGKDRPELLWQSDDVETGKPYEMLMEHFVTALDGADVLMATGEDGCKVLTAALAACESARSGRAIGFS